MRSVLRCASRLPSVSVHHAPCAGTVNLGVARALFCAQQSRGAGTMAEPGRPAAALGWGARSWAGARSFAAAAADPGAVPAGSESDSHDALEVVEGEHGAMRPSSFDDMKLEDIEKLSRKKQQHTLLQLLKGRGDTRADDDEEDVALDRTMDMSIIDVNRTVKVTKGGSLMRFTALVVVGNGDGVVGWAKGKAPEVSAAVDKAYWRAARSLFYFDRFEGCTIYHSATGKFGKTTVQIAPLRKGTGIIASPTVQAVCELAGIKDLRAKVLGSHNPHTTIRAIFEALDAVRTPEEISQMRGREVIRVDRPKTIAKRRWGMQI